MAWLLRLILLVAPCYLALIPRENLIITQSPAGNLQLQVRQSVEITCSWNVSSEVEQFRVEWKKRNYPKDSVTSPWILDQGILIQKHLYNYTVSLQFSSGLRKECLKLENVNKNHSGIYFCEITIEIPTFVQGKGNGTFLTVKEKDEKSKLKWLWWALAIFLFLILYICLSYYCKKQRNSPRFESNRTDEEEGEEDEYIIMENKHNKVERTLSNTTEWAVSVLYEPMNSFAKKPVELNDNDIYTLIYSNSLPAPNTEPSAIELTTSPCAPEAHREVQGKGRSLNVSYRQSSFSSASTDLTSPTIQTKQETGVQENKEYEVLEYHLINSTSPFCKEN
ncbi:uncharacterized protein LOC127540078 [Antechinus flavipes]|uniref:uncharacterized protein LOC127540078 n=1 Tax=Antechinus flavipes TaxID=38775 RepID=UPI0022364ED1|nr:uncharacterized protein LOC127540078 [Antechinus flavipes]